MGLFGSNQGKENKNLADVFPPGTPFRMNAAELQGLAGEPGNQRQLATVTVSPVDEHENLMHFGVWGSLAEQLTQLEAGELPAIVTLTDATGIWQFAPHGPMGTTTVEHVNGQPPEEVPQRVDVSAHMVPDAAADSTLPSAASERQPSPAPEVPDGGHRPPVSTDPPKVKPTAIDESQVFDPGANQ